MITLGIIGVVAAITIPGLITAYKAHQLKSQFLKAYSTIQQAFKQMEGDDVSTNPADYPSRKDTLFYKTLMRYLNAPMDCGNYYEKTHDTVACYDFSDTSKYYLTFDGNSKARADWFDAGQILLQDGTLVGFESVSSNNHLIHVDLNGFAKKPNRWGYDLFTFQFVDGEIITMGSKNTNYTNMNTYCNKNAKNSLNGIACAHKAKTEADYFTRVVNLIK